MTIEIIAVNLSSNLLFKKIHLRLIFCDSKVTEKLSLTISFHYAHCDVIVFALFGQKPIKLSRHALLFRCDSQFEIKFE